MDTANRSLQVFIDIAEHQPRFVRSSLPSIVNAMLQITSAPQVWGRKNVCACVCVYVCVLVWTCVTDVSTVAAAISHSPPFLRVPDHAGGTSAGNGTAPKLTIVYCVIAALSFQIRKYEEFIPTVVPAALNMLVDLEDDDGWQMRRAVRRARLFFGRLVLSVLPFRRMKRWM